jgi:hypothetical protein
MTHLKNTSQTLLYKKKSIKQHEDLRQDPRYKHVVHKGKDARINRQLLKEGSEMIREYLNEH